MARLTAKALTVCSLLDKTCEEHIESLHLLSLVFGLIEHVMAVFVIRVFLATSSCGNEKDTLKRSPRRT